MQNLAQKIIPIRYFRTFEIAAGKAAGSITDIGIPQEDSDIKGPFNIINIINQSAQLISFIPDGDSRRKMMVPGTFDKVFDDIQFRELVMKNEDGAAITSSKVWVSVVRDVGSREFMQMIADIVSRNLTAQQQARF